jgi:hypothetical protein
VLLHRLRLVHDRDCSSNEVLSEVPAPSCPPQYGPCSCSAKGPDGVSWASLGWQGQLDASVGRIVYWQGPLEGSVGRIVCWIVQPAGGASLPDLVEGPEGLEAVEARAARGAALLLEPGAVVVEGEARVPARQVLPQGQGGRRIRRLVGAESRGDDVITAMGC